MGSLLPLGSVFVIFVVFVLCNIPFAVLDLTGWPSSLLQYKIQEEKAVPVGLLWWQVGERDRAC